MFEGLVNKVFDKVMWVLIIYCWIAFFIDVTVQHAARVF